MRLVASCVFVSALVALVHPACYVEFVCSDGWIELDHKKSFVTELMESAVYGLDEHDYTHERLTQFVKERMDRCFTSENVSLFAPKQPVVNRTNWNVQLIDHQDFRSSHIVAKKGLGLGYNLGRFLYTYRCYYSFFPTTWLYYVFIEQRVATTSVSTTISEPVCDSNLPEGRDKWCRRIPYFFTRFKC